jgi:hypothetical protein
MEPAVELAEMSDHIQIQLYEVLMPLVRFRFRFRFRARLPGHPWNDL